MIRRKHEMESEVRPNMRGGPGRVTITHYFKPPEFIAPVRLCAKMTLAPGAGVGLHDHAAEDEVYVILAGQGLLDDGRVKTTVGAGDAILTGRGGQHAITNNGQENLEVMAFIATYPKN